MTTMTTHTHSDGRAYIPNGRGGCDPVPPALTVEQNATSTIGFDPAAKARTCEQWVDEFRRQCGEPVPCKHGHQATAPTLGPGGVRVETDAEMACGMADRRKRTSELMQELGNIPVKIGLRQQGHMETVERMLRGNATWEEIGDEIGWQAAAVREWWAREVLGDLDELRRARDQKTAQHAALMGQIRARDEWLDDLLTRLDAKTEPEFCAEIQIERFIGRLKSRAETAERENAEFRQRFDETLQIVAKGGAVHVALFERNAQLSERIAHLERQRDDLQGANTREVERRRVAEQERDLFKRSAEFARKTLQLWISDILGEEVGDDIDAWPLKRVGERLRVLHQAELASIFQPAAIERAARKAARVLTEHERDRGKQDDLFREVVEVILSAIREEIGEPR